MSRNSKLFVTGAAGHLGGLVIDALLERVPADIIVAASAIPTRKLRSPSVTRAWRSGSRTIPGPKR